MRVTLFARTASGESRNGFEPGGRTHLPVWTNRRRRGRNRLLAAALAAGAGVALGQTTVRELIVTNDLTLERDARLAVRLVVRANHVTIDGQGATLEGPAAPGDTNALAGAGAGVLLDGVANVTVRQLKVHGFAIGLHARDARALTIEGCDFSDNYHNPGHGWGELPPRGGLLLERVRESVIRNNRANRVWDALHLIASDDNLVEENDFSRCSNTCAKLWRSCRNRFLTNNLSYGIRIDREAGEVHARDSTSVLIESGSDDNYWYRNDITHGGDGIFIRVLNGWVSRGNVFVENDTSYANNNCVESWSPGNTYIRNRANHGSYGFWLGGSDQTVLIGNEAAYNGLTNGHHHAPEPGFGHGGIVIVGGPSSHTLIAGNHVHHNNGGGIVFRGDVGSRGGRWRTHHWVVQENRLEHNRLGVWGRWGSALHLANNIFSGNAEDTRLEDVTELFEAPADFTVRQAPVARLRGPEIVFAGDRARFDAADSTDPGGRTVRFRWHWSGGVSEAPALETVFTEPGLQRVSLTVHNGTLAELAWRDVLVVRPVREELGTEGGAGRWGFECEGAAAGRGRVDFQDEAGALLGGRCLRWRVDPYPGQYVSVVYPRSRDAGWDWQRRARISFWIRAENENIPSWQDAGPVVRLHGPRGWLEFKPAGGGNLLNDPPFSEARWRWQPVVIPLAGDAAWTATREGEFDLGRVDALSVALDSWGWQPFTVWLDGLAVE
jgi:parallel beta-helix repeat protein